jgi:hypothetical protein
MGDREPTTRELVLNVLDLVGDDADIDEVIERLCFAKEIRQRLEEVKTEKTYTQEEAMQLMAKWLK